MSFKSKPKAPKGPQKTKQAALAAAHVALGKMAVEGIDFQLRNTGAGWVHEPMPPTNEPAKKRSAKNAGVMMHKTMLNGATPQEAVKKAKRAAKAPATPKEAAPDAKKTDIFVAMLKAQAGATSKQLEEAMGWKPHSVRGLLGTLRKRGVDVVSEKVKGLPTVYRIAADPVGDVL